MKTNYQKLLLLLTLGLLALGGCKKDKQVIEEPTALLTEHKHVRVLVSDELTDELSLIDPSTGKVEAFKAKYPKAAIYASGSGRYASLIHTGFNFVENFDSGLEFHGDHVDIKNAAKFAALTGEGNKPTHFKTKGNEIITFNDGDGTLSVANESNFNVVGAKMQTINAGNVAHHGAMTKFDNGNYAITVKDGSVSGTLPERVKIINASGAQIIASTIQTTGIHGNASDGKVSVFGSGSGILVVDQAGSQRLIAHPTGFGTAWFGTILEGGADGKFIGYTAAKGAYLINTTTNTVTPVLESTEIMQCVVDYTKKNLLVLLHDGTLKLFDLTTGSLKKEAKVLAATEKTETKKPTLSSTVRYAYIAMPRAGEVHQVNLSDLSNIKKIKVSATPYRLAVIGFENSESH